MKKLEDYVRCIPDFPSEGVMFRDITSVIQDPDGLKLAIDSMIEVVKEVDFDVVVGTESRGFIFGMPIAYALGKGFVPCRKRENFHVKRLRHHMPWSMAQLRLKFTKMQ